MNARIYTVFAIVICNMTSYRASKILVSLFAIELGASQFVIGALVALYSLFPMFVALYAGRLIDRLGMRWPMVLGSGGISLGLIVPFIWQDMASLYASAVLIGASHVFYNVSVQNLVGSLSAPDTRTRNFSNYGLIMALGSFLGPLTAGFSIDLYGHGRTYLFFSLLPLVALGIIWSLPFLKEMRGGVEKEKGASAGALDLLRNAPLRRVLIASAMVLTGIDLFQFYMPIYGHSVGLSASAIGIVLGAFAAAAFIVRIWLPRLARRVGEDRLITWALFFGAGIYLAFPLVDSALLLTAFAFVLGLTLGACQPLSLALVFSRAPESRSGEALGLRLTINNFTHLAVPLVFGSIGTILGVAPVFLANAGMLAAGGALTRRAGQLTKVREGVQP